MIDSTAIGTDADTVMPTLSTRYSDDAPKTMPRTAPTRTAGQVNSGIVSSGGTYGLWPTSGVDVSGSVMAMRRIPRKESDRELQAFYERRFPENTHQTLLVLLILLLPDNPGGRLC